MTKENKNKNPFDTVFGSNIEEKESSLSKKESFPHEKYQTVRIRPDDFKKLKRYAAFKETTMVEAITFAINKLDIDAAQKEFLEKDE